MIEALRSEFPILRRTVHGNKPLVYLDNAATTQKPQRVIDALTTFYQTSNANAHRGGHALGAEATNLYEHARATVATFIGATSESIVFTRGATESLNLLAESIERTYGEGLHGKSVVISEMEHHANIVPWQGLCKRTGAELRVIRILDDGTLDMQHARELIEDSCALVTVAHMSNVLGTVNDVGLIASWAHEHGVLCIVDGCQYVVHYDVDVAALGCDAYVFSGHKLYAPFGIGVLYATTALLAQLEPYQTGGAMIDHVSIEHTTFAEPPVKFEAGTPNIAGAIGLAAAIEWLRTLDRVLVQQHEAQMSSSLAAGIARHNNVRVVNGSHVDHGIVSVVTDGVHAHDLGILMDEQGIAVRTGHHCAMPLMTRLGVQSTLRASVALYTTQDDVDRCIEAFAKSLRMLG